MLANPDLQGNQAESSLAEAENKFMHFVRETQVNNTFIYREQLRSNAQRGNYFLRINMQDLVNFDDTLNVSFRNNPTEYIKVFESAVDNIYRVDYYDE